MGGGQLGRMFVHAAQRMGYRTAVLDPDPESPAGLISHHHVQTDYLDPKGLGAMRQLCAAITTEFENIPAPAMQALAEHRPVAPAAHALAIAQDRRLEKAHFQRCGVACAPYAVIDSEQDLEAASAALLPGILKTARLGYDGKGQRRVRDRAELATAWADLGRTGCVLEQQLALEAECSVLVGRGWDGAMVHFPLQYNLHRDGILVRTEVIAARLPAELEARAVTAARAVAQGLDYVGVLCVEFFVVRCAQGRPALLVNEIAPRPHNSGHYTIDACDQSQFDLQVRTLAGLPLCQPRQHSPAIMLNLMGDLWFDGQGGCGAACTPDWPAVLALPGAHLHLYGKLKAVRARKMGHLTLTGADEARVRATATQAAALLGITPD